ncbi:MAG: hypothetical protein K2H29_08305 [Oscillospiraceae bacterium]|nr:hypothetical protein [Oscillospiraceae bacterium]MDE5885056.1 hypothetical protein [Oscillospiraceae bacterium]
MMKKYSILLACMIVFSGCAKNDPENSMETVSDESQETTEFTESTTEPDYLAYDDPFILPMIFPVPDDADPYEIRKHYTFVTRKNGVIVCYNKMGVQFLEADCSWINTSSYVCESCYLDYSDFDFDNYPDFFVAEKYDSSYSSLSKSGKYFRFNPDMGLFEPWEELNEIGYQVNPYRNSNLEEKLNTNVWENGAYEVKTYQWQDEKLVMIERKCQYPVESENPEDKTYYSNFFSYVNGYEELYKREKLVYVNHAEWPQVTEIPIE